MPPPAPTTFHSLNTVPTDSAMSQVAIAKYGPWSLSSGNAPRKMSRTIATRRTYVLPKTSQAGKWCTRIS